MNLRASYQKQGFAAPIDLLTLDEVQQLRMQFDAVESTFDASARSIGMKQLHLEHPFLWSLATHPKLLAAVEAIAGPDLILIGTHFFVKYPGQHDAFVAWHQDATYWGLEPNEAVTAWIAIDDADADNGCMRVVPATHRALLREHGKSTRQGNLLSVNQSLDLSEEELTSARDIVLRAGQMSLHDGMLIHGSNPNGSNRRRAGYTVRYIPAHVRLVDAVRQQHAWKPILVHGVDRYGHHQLVDPPFATTLSRS